jgi:hypothetical protein
MPLQPALARIFCELQQSGILSSARIECIGVTALFLRGAADGIFPLDVGFRLVLSLRDPILIHAWPPA